MRLLVPDVAYFLQHDQEKNLLYIYSWLRDYSKHEIGVQLPRPCRWMYYCTLSPRPNRPRADSNLIFHYAISRAIVHMAASNQVERVQEQVISF